MLETKPKYWTVERLKDGHAVLKMDFHLNISTGFCLFVQPKSVVFFYRETILLQKSLKSKGKGEGGNSF